MMWVHSCAAGGAASGNVVVRRIDVEPLAAAISKLVLEVATAACHPTTLSLPSTLETCVAVAVCMDNGVELVASEVAVIEAGLTLVPVAPDCTLEEARHRIINTVPVVAALADLQGATSALAALCQEHGIPILLVEEQCSRDTAAAAKDSEKQRGCTWSLSLQQPPSAATHVHVCTQIATMHDHDDSGISTSTSTSRGGCAHGLQRLDNHAVNDDDNDDDDDDNHHHHHHHHHHHDGDDEADVNHVSHIFFTSGSTGLPKACAVTRRTLLEAVHNQRTTFNISANSAVFLGSTITFDPSLCDIFMARAADATVAVAPRHLMLTSLPECLQATRATHICTTPTLLQSYPRAALCPATLPALRTVALGGEPMAPLTAATWGTAPAQHRCRLFNVYGVTECCGYQSALEIENPASGAIAQQAPGEKQQQPHQPHQSLPVHRCVGGAMGTARLLLVKNHKHVSAKITALLNGDDGSGSSRGRGDEGCRGGEDGYSGDESDGNACSSNNGHSDAVPAAQRRWPVLAKEYVEVVSPSTRHAATGESHQSLPVHRCVGGAMGTARLLLVKNHKHVSAKITALLNGDDGSGSSRGRGDEGCRGGEDGYSGDESDGNACSSNNGHSDAVPAAQRRWPVLAKEYVEVVSPSTRHAATGEVWVVGGQMGLGYIAAAAAAAAAATTTTTTTTTSSLSATPGTALKGPARLLLKPHASFVYVRGVGAAYRTGDIARTCSSDDQDNDGDEDQHGGGRRLVDGRANGTITNSSSSTSTTSSNNNNHDNHSSKDASASSSSTTTAASECGRLQLLGRVDWQVKLLGRRVDLCGLESQYKQHLAPAVDAVAITAANQWLLCWVTPANEHHVDTHVSTCRTDGGGDGVDTCPHGLPTAPQPRPGGNTMALHAGHGGTAQSCRRCELLRSACLFVLRAHMPSYLVPRTMTCIRTFPTTSSGKLARKHLWRAQSRLYPALSPSPSSTSSSSSSSRPDQACMTSAAGVDTRLDTPLQQLIADVLSQHLPVPMQSPHDTFAQLGGDSLRAVRAVHALLAEINTRHHSNGSTSTTTTTSSSSNNSTSDGGGIGTFAERAAIAPAVVLTSTIVELEQAVIAAFPDMAPLNDCNDDDDADGGVDGVQAHRDSSGTGSTNGSRHHPTPMTTSLNGARERETRRLLAWAAESNDTAVMQLLIRAAHGGATPLMRRRCLAVAYAVACRHGSDGVVRLLNPHVRLADVCEHGCTPFTSGHTTSASTASGTASDMSAGDSTSNGSMMANGAGTDRPTQQRPLHLACGSGSEATVRAVLCHPDTRGGDDAVRRDGDGMTAVHHAARGGAGTRLLQLLLSQEMSKKGKATRQAAASRNKGSKATKGAHQKRSGGTCTVGDVCLHMRDAWGRTPLHWAVVNGHRTAVCALLDHGADATARDAADETPLMIAERRAQCRAADRGGLRPSVFGDIATLLGGSGKTVKLAST
ncbi:hypothetical protein PTSG_07767 [Salpingoeca rosetta]|uniref:AMP-dependent synthetase/ligase domain-containing protein n=1 Tax=Salpingoeca rosetta (strain ATCC 50818 / BSB-021) TaxID=946362 RepID=F2UGA0_SALR5|nr:uncharacterized protein PTSG_07767 [Salpingoeca rosetta]EGD75650.1 hypothetical protein PTSG_07767 [Salpingoeca rosetta]|eukprot:XP_004991571.1 hypothetical protein PTSG_07767 [Salpingoeca rosetta]